MHMLITGGAGFIGSHLAEALLAQGHHVTAVDNLATGRLENLDSIREHPNFQFIYETITNETVMDRLASLSHVIFHLAAAVGVELIVKDPVNTLETNIQGTEVMLRLARRYRTKILIASTSEVYGKSATLPFREDDDRVMGPTTKSRWSYAESKAIDEFLALAYHKQFGVPTIICRFFNTVGPRQTGSYGMVIPRFVGQALAGQPLTVYGSGEQTRCFCNVRDTVRAIIGLALDPAAVGEIYNVGSQEEVSMRELAERVLARTGSASSLVRVPYDQAYEVGFEDMQRRVPSIDKVKARLGWAPTLSLDETLDEVIAYFRGE
jgi:UDP-glucose 4-epimerase